MFDDEPEEAAGGWYAALAGAVLGAGIAGWWLIDVAVPQEALTRATAVRPEPWVESAHATSPLTARHDEPRLPAASAALAVAAATGAAGPAPVQYVGQWFDGGRRAVVLSHQGRSVVVHVPGMVDGRFEVVSATERELVLRDLGSGTTQRIAFGVTQAAAAAAPATAAPPEETTEEPPAVRVRPAKLPPLSQRTSDDVEPEN